MPIVSCGRKSEVFCFCQLPLPSLVGGLPLRSSFSGRAAGDLSRFASLDDSDRGYGGLFGACREGSAGVPEYEFDLDALGFFDGIRGISVGVSE